MKIIRPPEPLQQTHLTGEFTCGEIELDDFLKKRALKNQETGASRTYVVCEESLNVLAYYSLSAGSISRDEVTGKVRRNMPDPIPVMVLGRLAVDHDAQGLGLGKGLLRDAILRTVQAAELAGIQAIIVHAISEQAKEFYLRFGFSPSPIQPRTLMITMREARAAIE